MATVIGSQITHLWDRRGRSVRMGRSRREGGRGGGGERKNSSVVNELVVLQDM